MCIRDRPSPLALAPRRVSLLPPTTLAPPPARQLRLRPVSYTHLDVYKRQRKDWAAFIKGMLDDRYPQATKVRLVMDNLNTHSAASLYEAFQPEEARRLARRLEIHYTPKHGSWLNVAEIELSALNSQCLNRRIPDIDLMRKEVAAWELDRNNRATTINWRFTTEDARIKLKRIYPKL